MTGTLAEQVLQGQAGEIVDRPVDLLMGHDGSAVLVVDRFRNEGLSVWDSSRVLIVFDHFAPPATIERANIQNKLLEFVQDLQLPFRLYQGICHQLLVEHPKVVPGQLVVGADSHTVSAGALGSFATGVGATDFLRVLSTGHIWLRVPETIRVVFTGQMPRYLLGKDLILAILRELGEEAAVYKALEFHDYTETGISMDSRVSICNMSVELGAKVGMFVPDSITESFVKAKHGEYVPLRAGENARYVSTLEINVGELEPLIAVPHNVSHVVPVQTVQGTKVNQVFVGSCTSGRLEDFRAAAQLYTGRTIGPFVKTIMVPSSQSIFREAMRNGYVDACVAAGAVVTNSSCGPCCNIDKGLLGEHEVSLSTANRNFQGRMGALSSSVYLASTLTAVASSLTGIITDPREVIA